MFRLLRVKLVLIAIATIFYLPVLLLSKLLPKKKRGIFFRFTAIVVMRVSFFCGGIRIKKENSYSKGVPTIYISNHPSEMDGFLLQMILGTHVVPVVAPLEQFPYLIALWLKSMEAIDVVRDEIDHALYKHGHTKVQALHKAVSFLNEGKSILIFPEGHTELIEALYQFHTGAARIALASGAPLQTIVLKDAHRVFSDTIKSSIKTVTISFGKRILPEETYGESILFTEDERLRETVRAITKVLESEVLQHLPLHAIHDQRTVSTNVGVFVDIDLTIYRSLSQVDFLVYLTKKKLVPIHQTFFIIFLFMLEKLNIISHEHLVKKAIGVISGWRIETVDALMYKFFRDLAVPKIEYGLFAILEDHLAKGHHIVFVSEVMHPVAQAFVQFFEADKAIDTSLKKRNLTYTGEISLLCRGETKATEVAAFTKEENIISSESYAYGDSFSDVAFLSLTGHPTVVNPDRELRRYAKKNNWPILKKHV